jgi:ribonuclease-3
LEVAKTIDTEPKKSLVTIFELTKHTEIFHQALYPKALGGGNSFKILAIYGDNILNITLLDLITKDDSTDTGILTESLHSFHNSTTLTQLAEYLKIDEIMQESWNKPIIPNKDLKEAIEALLGATYLTSNIKRCKEVVLKLLSISIDNNFLNPNPIGILNILFQKKGSMLPKYISTRAGGPDHQAEFVCTIEGEYEGKKYAIKSSVNSSKKNAEKDAAKRFLEAIGQKNRLEYFHLQELNTKL